MKFILILATIIVALVASMYGAFVLSYLLLWFFGISISVVKCMGLGLIISMFTITLKPRYDQMLDVLVNSFIASTFSLAFGYVYSLFL